MRVTPLAIPGAWSIDIEPREDERGWFARTFCAEELTAYGIDVRVAQTNASWNIRRHTLRGMHYQAAPHGEGKTVRCTRGAIFDVLVDVRSDSATFGTWDAAELTAANRRALYAPPGVAHGFLTLEDATEVAYQMSVPYHPNSARGFRWDDPAVAIDWPHPPSFVSARDAELPTLSR